MPINLDRADKIGNNNDDYRPSIKIDPNLKYGDIEVLTINKIPFNKLSFIKNNH